MRSCTRPGVPRAYDGVDFGFWSSEGRDRVDMLRQSFLCPVPSPTSLWAGRLTHPNADPHPALSSIIPVPVCGLPGVLLLRMDRHERGGMHTVRATPIDFSPPNTPISGARCRKKSSQGIHTTLPFCFAPFTFC